MTKISRQIKVQNKLGLHARASAKLVQATTQFSCEVQIATPEMRVNAKSIMGVLMLAAAQGTQLEITAEGDQETCENVIAQVTILFDDLFGEGE